MRLRAVAIVALAATAVLAVVAVTLRPVRSFLGLAIEGDSKELSARGPDGPPVPEGAPTALVLALDGVDRRLLYDMLARGEMPHLARLLGPRDGGRFRHAHLDERILSPLPSSTLTGWATAFTGEPPAVHGVAGNEFFVREDRHMAAPAPVSFLDPSPVLETYTDDYANRLLRVPTVYELLHDRDPAITSWVSMSQYHAGADRLLLANRTVVADAFEALLSGAMADGEGMKLFAELDEEAVENVIEELEEEGAPRLLTVYLTGTDHYAHSAESGPDPARTSYLSDVADPLIGRLHDALEARGAMDDRTTILLSDHGHTEVLHDDVHALGTEDEGELPDVLAGAGFRVRPFELEVDDAEPFSAVIAYGGALAYVYVADRSTCPGEDQPCDWSRPARAEDVAAAADAIHRAASDPRQPLGGTIDLVIAPRDAARGDRRAIVTYRGDGRWEPLEATLRAEPRRSYVQAAERLRDLVDGPAGDRAGDLVLVARNGDEPRVEDRYYFAGLYRSWHGSPSRQDSEVPFIVAHPRRSAGQLRATVDRAVAKGNTLAVTTRVLLEVLAPAGMDRSRGGSSATGPAVR